MPTGNGQPRTYSIAADTAMGDFNSSALKNEIELEVAITTVLLRIDRTADVLDIHFVADLSGAEITALDTVVSNHSGVASGLPPPEMEFVAATEATSVVNSITINVPAGVVDGDTLLLQVTQTDNEDGNINTIAGWANPVANAGSGGAPPSEPATSIFTRIASSEPASYVATCDNPAAVGMVARMIAFRNGDPTTILDVSIVLDTHTGTANPNPPANTPVTRGCMAVAMLWHDDDLGVISVFPTGYTDPDGLNSVVTAGGGNGASIGSAFKLLTGALAVEDPSAFNVTDVDEGGTATILLRPQFEELPPPVAAEGETEVQDEGISLTLAVKKINFKGAGVTASEPVADEVDVTIPGGGGGAAKGPLVVVAKGDSKDAAYKVMNQLIFPGTDAAGTPTSISANVFTKDDIAPPTIGDFRIYDVTNALAIAEVIGIQNTSKQNIEDLGTLSNLDAAEALWELQGRRTSGSGDDAKIEVKAVTIFI